MMQIALNKLSSATTILIIFLYSFLFHLQPLVSGYSDDGDRHRSDSHKHNKNSSHQLSPQKISHIKVHGALLWASMGFLMPIGILIIRISGRERRDSTRARVFFYLHVFFQGLSAILATAGGVMSLRNFENTFNNNHQRIGLVLYCTVWFQVMIGLFRPKRGNKARKEWFLVHWILGTLVSLAGILNTYTGLEAYHKRTLRSTRLWTILFTAEVALISLIYLFQDKKEYIEKQGLVLANLEAVSPHQEDHHHNNNNNANQINNHNNNDNTRVEFVPQPCVKRNALKNLFEL